MLGYKVLLVDADSSNPSVGFHLGMEDANIGFKNMVSGKVKMENAVLVHGMSGLHVICGTINSKPFIISRKMVDTGYSQIRDSNYNFVVVDTQPGYFAGDITGYIDLALVVTTPDMPSYTSAIRLSDYFTKQRTDHNAVINRIHQKRYELSAKEIEEAYSGKVVAELPEDDIVPISIGERIPAIMLDPHSKFSRAMKDMAKTISLDIEAEPASFTRGSFWSRILRMFQRR